MVALHGAWLDGQGLLWAETSPSGGRSAVASAGKNPPPWSPYDAGRDVLIAALAALNADFEPAQRRPAGGRIAWLPTLDGRPIPSRAFLTGTARPGSEKDGMASAPWRVTALPLEWDEWLTLLGALADGPRLARGVIAGIDLQRWAEALRYAGALVARRSFLPAIRRRPDGVYESRWLPVLGSADSGRARAIAERLPAAATALTDEPPLPAKRIAPADAVFSFIEEAVDRLVRAAAATRLSRAHAEHGRYFSVHDAWIASLRGDRTREIRWHEPEDIEALAVESRQWRRPVDLGARADCRICFRLEAPRAADSEAWTLRCLVQRPRDAASGATLPLSDIWRAGTLDAAEREGLLMALGQAATLCPVIAYRPLEHLPDGRILTTGEAHHFLSHQAPLLEAAGYIVHLPDGLTAKARQPRLELVARAAPTGGPAKPGGLTLDTRVAVNWEIALGGERVSAAELEALTAAGESLARFRGRWIEIDRTRVAEALRLRRRQRVEWRKANDIVRFMLGTDAAEHGFAVSDVIGSGWIDDLLRRLRGEIALNPLALPAGFVGELRPYQQRGHAWLAFLRQWGLGACLADDMGLGKTVQTLALLAGRREQGERRPVLLVCPTSVLTNWVREATRFVPGLPVKVHHGPSRNVGHGFASEARRYAVVATSYTLLDRDYDCLRRVAWSGIVLDEAQNIKNADTRQSQAARALRSDYRIALTGTPVENHVGDLWAIMDFLNPGLLGTRAEFRDNFLRPIQAGTDPRARETLRWRTAPFILRRLKTDRDVIPDLPDKREARVFCPLTREQASLYESVVRDLIATTRNRSGVERQGLVLATLTRLKQICNHPAHFLGDGSPLDNRSGKLARLDDMLAETIEEGAAALVFTQYAAMGALLQQHLQQEFGLELPFLHGGTTRATRDAMIATFQAPDGPPIFVLSLKAGGAGLNLTRASHVFHYDRWWNPAVENQATDRAFRIGQTRDVMAHKFICAGTLEEKIDAMIESKAELANEIVAGGEAWLSRLNDEQLYDVLALSQEAVEDEV